MNDLEKTKTWVDWCRNILPGLQLPFIEYYYCQCPRLRRREQAAVFPL